MSTKPYEKRTDLEKCQSQWWKLQGLHTREEWSAALVRAATAAKIAANYVLRDEFRLQSELSARVIDKFLLWANGLAGKIDHLLVPLSEGTPRAHKIVKLRSLASEINKTRNAVVHRGEFRDEDEATEAIAKTKLFIEGLVRLYEPAFKLRKRRKRPSSN